MFVGSLVRSFVNMSPAIYLKWLEIEALFQWTANRNWHMENRMVTWTVIEMRDGSLAEVYTLWVIFLVLHAVYQYCSAEVWPFGSSSMVYRYSGSKILHVSWYCYFGCDNCQVVIDELRSLSWQDDRVLVDRATPRNNLLGVTKLVCVCLSVCVRASVSVSC